MTELRNAFKALQSKVVKRRSVADRLMDKTKEMDGLIYAVCGSFGLSLNRGVQNPVTISSVKIDPKTNICLKFSNNGQYLCYCDSSRTVVIETSTGDELMSEELSKTQHIAFSPRDNFMVTYEPYVVYGSRIKEDGTARVPKPNLRFWSLKERKVLETYNVKKQSAWRPQFTEDESKIMRLSEQGLFVYENCHFNEVKRVHIKDLEAFELSPGRHPHLMCFIPGVKGQPAILQLRDTMEDFPIKYSKTSFNCDKCTMTWNSKGNFVLVTASVDVDKTDKSYYGVSHLYCISIKQECFQVPLEKPGPLYCVEWAPHGREFCVCYGFMPSKVTIFNVKGDPVWNIGEAHRNEIYYNPFGDILVTCGFGNISSGKMNFWNVEKRTEIIEHEAPLTTQFEWAPDGKHFLTATTTPRLRTSNGYRIWDYSQGIMNYSVQDKEELWQVVWRPSKSYSKPDIPVLTKEQRSAAFNRNQQISGGPQRRPLDNLPPGAITKSGVYVPPQMRKSDGNNKPNLNRSQMTDVEKKQRNLQKKLDEIARLREKRERGAVLEKNQIEKIQNEAALRFELEQLKLAN